MNSKTKKILIPFICIASALLLTAVIFIILWYAVWKIDVKVVAQQIGDTQELKVSFETSKRVNKVIVDVTHNGDLVSSQTITNKAIIEQGYVNIYAYYGKHEVKVTVYDDGIYNTCKKTTAKLFTDEYNIAPITATMPVTMFSLNIDNITDNGGKNIPTFAWFKRSGAWDWSKLPNNVYAMPVAKMNEFYNSDETVMYSKTSAWVKELYELNKTSKFNFFYNDYYAYGWLKATVANGIPAENYHVTLLSDGTASFSYFNKHFNNNNPQANYDSMKTKYNKLKTQIKDTKNYKENSGRYCISTDDIREYAYVMATEEPNVEWWLSRIAGTLNSTPEFYSQVEKNPSVKVKDLKTMLMALSEEQKVQLKALYNFNDAMFEKAEKENKEVMVILGTWTQDEDYFADYVHATMDYYGDQYIYYYKGHPKNPTNSEKGKLENLNKLGLIDVDSTIAAELILFFNPDIYLSGYASSTYVSAEDKNCSSIFNTSKEGALANSDMATYRDNMDYFITKVSHNSDKYGAVVPNDSNNYYVLEFNDTSKHEIAIYNASNRTMTYYKLINGTYVVVSK